VLVENGFADAGAFCDFVHARGVIAPVDKDIAGRDEQLATTLVTRQSVAAPGSGAGLRPTPSAGVGKVAHQVLIVNVLTPVQAIRG
jgi:hypothetical protein